MNKLLTSKEIINYINMLNTIKFMISCSLDWQNFYEWFDNWDTQFNCIEIDEI